MKIEVHDKKAVLEIDKLEKQYTKKYGSNNYAFFGQLRINEDSSFTLGFDVFIGDELQIINKVIRINGRSKKWIKE